LIGAVSCRRRPTTQGGPSMAKASKKPSKPEAAKPQKIERQDSTPHDDQLTDEQLRKVTGGGGGPPVVVD
jgi:hypothetical protein